jgi:hypothetical protein
MIIPTELTKVPQWITWKYLKDGTKFPNGKSNDPSSWHRFQDVESSKKIAFVFADEDPFCGIDLDDCIVEGEILQWAQVVLDKFAGVAYAEFSPSGSGIKLITRAKKPAGSRCNNGSGIECYDKKRFWTITRDTVPGFEQIGDGQSAVDWLLENCFQKPDPPKKTTREVVERPASSLHDRAQDYIDNCEQAGEGSRNQRAFNIAGHLRAIVEDGSRLQDSDVLHFVSLWNSRNSDPLPDKEIAKAVESSAKNGTPREDKEPQILINDDSDVDLTNFLNSFERDDSPTVDQFPVDPGPFPLDCLEPLGFIGEVARYTLATSDEPQPILALGGAMCLLSALTGRKIRNRRNNRTNIFVLALAPSGAGKDRPRQVNMDILQHIGHPELIGANSLGSGHGIESQLKAHPSKVFHLDELGDLLKAIKKDQGGFKESVLAKIKMLMTSSHQVYSNSATADSKLFFTIDQPHLVIFGTATPEKFWSNISTDSIEDGFMGRVFPLEVVGYAETQEPAVNTIPDSILEQAKAWADFVPGSGNLASENPTPAVYEMSAAANERHYSYCREIDRKIPKDGSHKPTDGLWKRARGRSATLALLFAASRCGPSANGTIEKIDVDLAIKITNWITRRTIYKICTQVSENMFESNCNRMLELLKKYGECDRTKLSQVARWLKPKERREVLEQLLERNAVIQLEEKTDTKTRVIFKAKSNN